MEAGLEEYTRSSFRKLFNYVSLSAFIYRIKATCGDSFYFYSFFIEIILYWHRMKWPSWILTLYT